MSVHSSNNGGSSGAVGVDTTDPVTPLELALQLYIHRGGVRADSVADALSELSALLTRQSSLVSCATAQKSSRCAGDSTKHYKDMNSADTSSSRHVQSGTTCVGVYASANARPPTMNQESCMPTYGCRRDETTGCSNDGVAYPNDGVRSIACEDDARAARDTSKSNNNFDASLPTSANPSVTKTSACAAAPVTPLSTHALLSPELWTMLVSDILGAHHTALTRARVAAPDGIAEESSPLLAAQPKQYNLHNRLRRVSNSQILPTTTTAAAAAADTTTKAICADNRAADRETDQEGAKGTSRDDAASNGSHATLLHADRAQPSMTECTTSPHTMDHSRSNSNYNDNDSNGNKTVNNLDPSPARRKLSVTRSLGDATVSNMNRDATRAIGKGAAQLQRPGASRHNSYLREASSSALHKATRQEQSVPVPLATYTPTRDTQETCLMQDNERDKLFVTLFRHCGAETPPAHRSLPANSHRSTITIDGGSHDQSTCTEPCHRLRLTCSLWQRMIRRCHRTHRTLPPQPVLDVLYRTLHDSESSSSGGDGSTADSAFGWTAFVAAAQAECAVVYRDMRSGSCETTGKRKKGISPHSCAPDKMNRVKHVVPCWLIFCAAVVPQVLRLLIGQQAVRHLRSIGTVHAALSELIALTLPASHLCHPCSTGVPLNDAAPASNTLHKDDMRNQTKHSNVLDGLRDNDDSNTDPTNNNKGCNRGAQLSCPHMSVSSLQAPRSPTAAEPHYLKARPMDELTRCAIARARARRLMGVLRHHTVPIDRMECYAKLESTIPTAMLHTDRHARPPAHQLSSSSYSSSSSSSSHSSRSSSSTSSAARPSCATDPAAPQHAPAQNSASSSTANASSNITNTSATINNNAATTTTNHLSSLSSHTPVSHKPSASNVLFTMHGLRSRIPAHTLRTTFDRLSKPSCDPRLFTGAYTHTTPPCSTHSTPACYRRNASSYPSLYYCALSATNATSDEAWQTRRRRATTTLMHAFTPTNRCHESNPRSGTTKKQSEELGGSGNTLPQSAVLARKWKECCSGDVYANTTDMTPLASTGRCKTKEIRNLTVRTQKTGLAGKAGVDGEGGQGCVLRQDRAQRQYNRQKAVLLSPYAALSSRYDSSKKHRSLTRGRSKA